VQKTKQQFDRSIVDGPIGPAVWRLAWPTMLQNVIAGIQGIIDHVMVGHYGGYTANAAIGVSWQIVVVVIVFMTSLFTGMAVLVARFAGANEPEKVNRVVYQAFLTAVGLAALLTTIGYFASPALLDCLHKLAERTERLLSESDVFATLIEDWHLGLEVSVINRLAHRLTRILTTGDPLCDPVHLKISAVARLTIAGVCTGASGRLGRLMSATARKPRGA